MVQVKSAYKQDRYEKNGLENLRPLSNIKVFANQDGQPAKRTQLTTKIHMLLIWIKNNTDLLNSLEESYIY